jgi:hypothetical protein
MIVIDSLGELMPGSMPNAATYGIPVEHEVMNGAIGDRLLQADPSLMPACVDAGMRLARLGFKPNQAIDVVMTA